MTLRGRSLRRLSCCGQQHGHPTVRREVLKIIRHSAANEYTEQQVLAQAGSLRSHSPEIHRATSQFLHGRRSPEDKELICTTILLSIE
jgi:hypothetical protein